MFVVFAGLLCLLVSVDIYLGMLCGSHGLNMLLCARAFCSW